MRTIAKIAVTATLAAACATTPEAPPEPIREKAEVYRIEIRDQDFTEFTALAHLQMPPNVSPVTAHWEVLTGSPPNPRAKGESSFAAADVPEDGVIQVGGRSAYTSDPEELTALMEQEGSMPVIVRGHVVGSNGVHYEFTRAGRVRTPRVPEVKIHQVEAGAIPSERRVGLVFFFRIDNPNAFDVPLENVEYDLEIDGVAIDRGVAGTKRMIPRGGGVEIDLPVNLDESNFPQVGAHLKGSSQLQYKVKGQVRLAMGRIPFELSGPISIRVTGH